MSSCRRVELRNGEFLRTDYVRRHGLTRCAQTILQHTMERSLLRGITGEVPALMILWSMLRWEKRVGLAIIELCGVDLRSLEQDVENKLDEYISGSKCPTLDFIRIQEVVEAATKEAADLRHDYVATEHFVLALCRKGECDISRLFEKHNLGYEFLKDNLVKLYSDPGLIP